MATLSSTTSIKLAPDVKARVQRIAAARRRTPHWIMREAVEQYLEREEKRERFRRETRTAWEDYQATGLHLTAAEADAWLASAPFSGAEKRDAARRAKRRFSRA